MKGKSPSLVARVLIFTSLATVALFSASAYLLGSYALGTTRNSIENEIESSLREVEVQWRTRADSLARASLLLSRMSDVRSAFLTKDIPTIRDTANDMWSQVSNEPAVFFILDPEGRRLASLGGGVDFVSAGRRLLQQGHQWFPVQARGFVLDDSARLYFTVLTPVYVDSSAEGQALIDVLVTGFAIDDVLAKALSAAAGGADFVFSARGRVAASTLAGLSLRKGFETAGSGPQRRKLEGTEYAILGKPLLGLDNQPLGELYVMKSLAATDALFRKLELQILGILLAALSIALALSYALMRRVMARIQELDRGASEIAGGNYQHRIIVTHDDELSRLARTFNSMCDSIEASRKDLISYERMNTIGRLSSSIVHDLRNPLAAIYGGAEMLADDESLTRQQSQRLVSSIYRASRHIQDLLRGLADSSRGKAEPIEVCQLAEVVHAAVSLIAPGNEIEIEIAVPSGMEMPLERSRMERVFLNLMGNALDAMQTGGWLRVTAREADGFYLVAVDDTGTGISNEVRSSLFQPFFSQGKRNGLGLGLALSRQTVLDHGGDLWEEQKAGPGARFVMKLPKSAPGPGSAAAS